MKILFTGGTGFVGKNVLPILREKYTVDAPTRQELDLKSERAVKEYIINGKYDVVIHSANPNPVKSVQYDSSNTMFEDSMRVFMNFYNVRQYYGKMLYLGSGAEFDKSRDIHVMKEEEVTTSLPKDVYGFSKYIMNELSQKSGNIYNLRLFACYGPFDHESKFITHAIRCCLREASVSIRQDCLFDYVHVFDLERILEFFIESTPKYHDYNICSGQQISLKEIARKVCEKMKNERSIIIAKIGWNKEYTADNSRLLNELSSSFQFINIDNGIEMQINHERMQVQ
ncbi:MAG: NAD(P)-dependent oxidoreductase [Lachnospiraceae bacterium]